MRDLNYLNTNRIIFFGQLGNEHNGAFELKIKGEKYIVVASDGLGWEHVSISHKHKIPSWSVMCIVKDMFFEEDETDRLIKEDYEHITMKVNPEFAKRNYEKHRGLNT